MSKTDSILRDHLDKSTVFRGDSNHIQNDLLQVMAEVY